MTKSLSESHPTLWNTDFFFDRELISDLNNPDVVRVIVQLQSCTVDVAEHERVVIKCDDYLTKVLELQSEVARLKKEIEAVVKLHGENEHLRGAQMMEVERLKKELEDRKFNLNNAIGAGLFNEERQAGILEGERRAMERLKVFIVKARQNSVEFFGRSKPEWCEGVEETLKELERTFGLGEEDKR